MVTGYVPIAVGEYLRVGDQVYYVEDESWKTVDKHAAGYGMTVTHSSMCRRPVGESSPDNAAGEWEDEKNTRPTPEEELAKTNEYLQRVLIENMELHNRSQRLQEHVDSLKKQLAALEEKLKAQEKTNSAVIKSAEQERTRLITERDNLRQEVYDLQHSLAVERRRLQSLDVGSAERNTAQGSLLRYEKKIAELQQRLQVSEEGRLRLLHTDSVSAEQPETELEQKAWELFSRIPDLSVDSSFFAAEAWIAERDRKRKESGK